MAPVEIAAHVAGEALATWWNQLGSDPDRERSLDFAFKEALATIGKAFDADAVALLLTDESGEELVARAAVGLSEEVTLGLRIRIGQGMAGRVIAQRRPLIVDELSEIEVVSPVLRYSGLHSIVAVPLISGDNLFGVIYAGSEQAGRFDPEDASLMELLAGRVAVALERVRLFENERTARRQAEQARDQLKRMQTVTSLLASAITEEQVGVALSRAMLIETPGGSSRASSFWLCVEDSLVPVRESSTEGDLIAISGDSPLAVAARERNPVYLTDAQDLLRSHALPGFGSPELSILAALPIIVSGEPAGVLAVAYPEPHEFVPDELEFLSALVTLGTQAFERAHLYEQQQRLAQMSSYFARAVRVTAEAADLLETLDRLGTLALEVLGDICLIDVVDDSENLVRMVALHKDASMQPVVDRLKSEYPPDASGDHPAAAVVRGGKVMWDDEMSRDFLFSTTRDDEHFKLTQALGFRSYMAVPLAADGRILGAMTLVSTGRRFTRRDVSFAETLAKQVAAVVDNARQFDVTSHISQILQASLLPQELPVFPGLQVHTLYLPATQGLEIGGDFYDLIGRDDGEVWFIVGDVAGHDSVAAAMMGHLRSAARAFMSRVLTPGELVQSLQGSWNLLGFKRIATAVCGTLRPETGELVIASAGHYPPLLLSAGSFRFLEVQPSPPLGVLGGEIHQWTGRMEKGELLVLYTDGAIDERTVGSEKSMHHLAEAASDGPLTAADVCDRIISRLDVDRTDDIALMAIKRIGS